MQSKEACTVLRGPALSNESGLLDLARGVLNTLVNNIVGTGIRIEALAKDKKGVRQVVVWKGCFPL